MKSILYITVLMLFITSCGNNSSKKKDIAYVVEKVNYNVGLPQNNKVKDITLTLPVIGKISLSQMKKDSTNHYSFENCKGKVAQYSSKNRLVVIDSLSCGDEAHVYTIYVLDKEGNIRYVDEQKLGMSLIPGQQVYWYVQSEKVYDFTSTPANLSVRADTLETIPTKQLDQSLKTNPLEDAPNRLDLWTMKFKGLWRLK